MDESKKPMFLQNPKDGPVGFALVKIPSSGILVDLNAGTQIRSLQRGALPLDSRCVGNSMCYAAN